MSTWDPWLLLVAALPLAFLMDLLARSRSETRDSGPFWAAVLARFIVIVGAPALLFAWIRPSTPSLQNWGPSQSSAWLLIVLSLWALLLLVSVFLKIERGSGRWLAGAIGFTEQRYWLAGFVLVLAPALYFNWGGWTEGYNAAPWAVALLVGISLIAAALSSEGRPAPAPARVAAKTREVAIELADWPQGMRAEGIVLEELATARGVLPNPDPTPHTWTARLEAAGAHWVPPALIDPVHQLVQTTASHTESERCSLVFAPPYCGQAEITALAAMELAQRMGEVTLVITPSESRGVVAELRHWAKALHRSGLPLEVEAVERRNASFADADVWVADAAMLSDFLLGFLQQETVRIRGTKMPLVSRIGLIVWWQVDTYSGVKAANLWAISRRLKRLLDTEGRSGIRVLALSRGGQHAIAQVTSFFEHLLPYPFRKEREVHVDAKPVRDTKVHVVRAPLARAAAASLNCGWPTAVDERHAQGGRAEAVLQGERAAGQQLSAKLVLNPAAADARLLALSDGDVLALPAFVPGGGRLSRYRGWHHIGVVPSGNPYVEFLLRLFSAGDPFGVSRYLVGAEGHASIVQRHAQLALTEMSDTMSGLQSVFRWEWKVVADTLRQLHERNQLHKQAVRFLNTEKRLQRDYLYSNLQPDTAERRPLETVGVELIEVRDTAVAGDEGLHLEIDPERITIDGYPRRVFYHNDRRFRIAEWKSKATHRLACSPEDLDVRTDRVRNMWLQRLQPDSAEMLTWGLRRYTAFAEYKEELTAVVEQSPGGPLRHIALALPVDSAFSTRALILELQNPELANENTLHGVAMVLRHVLPVHIGVDQDFLEVLPLAGRARLENGRPVWGLGIVDLLPGGGVGLIEAIQEDEALLQMLLDFSWRWTADCLSRGMSARAVFGESALARATGGVEGVDLRDVAGVLDVLRRRTEQRA